MSVPMLAIVGSSNAGKTTLMENLVAALSERGLQVATIKHSHHQPDLDTVGKDSWRHKQAGAKASLLVGPEKLMLVEDLVAQPSPQQLVAAYFAAYDLVLLEGYAAMPCPKIEVLRAAQSSALRCDPQDLLAVVTDIDHLNLDIPQLDLNDTGKIVAFIVSWMEQGECVIAENKL